MKDFLEDTKLTIKFSNFVSKEREQYLDKNNNRVAFSLGQVARYVRFIEITRKRYDEVALISHARFNKVMSWTKSGAKSEKRELTPDEVKELDNDWRINLLLHMEIETYFLFSNILLDKIAHCIEDFFGPVRSTTFRSHDQCCKNIENYSQCLRLELPDRFIQTALNLRDIVTEFRDKQITHFRHPRAMHATMYHPEDGIQIVINAIYPKPNDKQVNSPGIIKISQDMNEYIELFIELIQGNRDKCRYN